MGHTVTGHGTVEAAEAMLSDIPVNQNQKQRQPNPSHTLGAQQFNYSQHNTILSMLLPCRIL